MRGASWPSMRATSKPAMRSEEKAPAESGTISIPALRSPNMSWSKLAWLCLQQLCLASRCEPRLNIAVILQLDRGGRGLARRAIHRSPRSRRGG